MALSSSKEYENSGAMASYFKVVNSYLDHVNNNARVTVHGWINQAAYDADKDPLIKTTMNCRDVFSPELSNSIENNLENFLKKEGGPMSGAEHV